MKSDVYFVKIESQDTEERISAFKKLLDRLKPFPGYQKEEIIPVKLTIGEPSCTYHINPELVRVVILEIKKQGAKPFLFDTSVIYQGQRQNAVDHLTLVQNKGFGHSKVGAPFVIADGLLGQDGKEYIIDAQDIKKIKVPSFIGMLDNLLVLSHATGHIVSGYAGAIKNVAMGMSCRPTKQVQHSSLKPSVIVKNCTACGCCIAICPVKAISFKDKKAFTPPFLNKLIDNRVERAGFIDSKICIGCGDCICACKFDAIFINWQEEPAIFCKRMVEVAHFILSKFKNKFFINFAFDITKECDCISNKDDKMIAENLGLLASSDIVSLDKATVDLANKKSKSDFLSNTKNVYEIMLEYAARKGLGNLEYNLINV
jgi:hypothetical protein